MTGPLRNALMFSAVCAAAAWAYWPGLAGGFLFDDLINLPALGATGAIDNWPAFWRYLTSGTADPTGRPVALLSFLLDARDWPADPAPFLRTNLALHLANGALLFLLLRRLGRHLGDDARTVGAAALVGAGLWLLHPLFVSTTPYIVQREAMLPATFVLLGLLAWLHGRERHTRGERGGVAWMLAGLGLGTLLAVLSKANGALLPLLALVLEATVLKTPASEPPPRRRLRLAPLVLPAACIFAYLASYLPRLHAAIDYRPWTIAERLLTQPRVLLDYLQQLAVPRVLSTGLYNDGYAVSTGLATPWTTLPAVIALLALLVFAIAARRRFPAWSAALLFFFAGHLLESSVVPLELYFEHRNYLPAMLLFWPLARALWRHGSPSWLRAGATALLLAICGLTTHQRATLWGQPDRMALLWARQNPDSPRAQAAAAMSEIANGQPLRAMQRVDPLWQRRPHELQLALNHVDAACQLRGLRPAEVEAVRQAFRHDAHGQQLAYEWLGQALAAAANGRCAGLDLGVVASWLDAAAANPAMQAAGRRQDLATLQGRLALLRGQPDIALAYFDRALAAYFTPAAAAQQAALLASRGHHAQALAHLDTYRALAPDAARPRGMNIGRLREWVLERQGYWHDEHERLRELIRADLEAGQAVDRRDDAAGAAQ
jgi:tetratricopeptide (TPR) repeat protein